MTSTLETNYDFRKLEFSKDGSPVHPEQAAAVGELADQVDDLIVISHGWNNDENDAQSLYEALAASFDSVRAANREPKLAGRNIGIVGVFWPSKKFAESDLIPGGAASIGHSDPTLAADLVDMSDGFDAPTAEETMRKAAKLVPLLEQSSDARRQYADLLRSLIKDLDAEPGDAADVLFDRDGDELMQDLDPAALLEALTAQEAVHGGGVAGGALQIRPGALHISDTGSAAGLPFGLGSLWSKGRSLLNYVTYYQMKARAGSIGEKSVAPILAQQVVGKKARLHLVGHSFGARLVTAAGNSLGGQSISSVSLLQAAFSHFAFADHWSGSKDGAFRHLLTAHNINGPMIITHTRNDRAVGLAYAIASRVGGQNASAIGDKNDPFGGLGSNGAQKTPEAKDNQDLGDTDVDYAFQAGVVHNLLADKFVSGHSDIRGPQVAHAVLRAVATGL